MNNIFNLDHAFLLFYLICSRSSTIICFTCMFLSIAVSQELCNYLIKYKNSGNVVV